MNGTLPCRSLLPVLFSLLLILAVSSCGVRRLPHDIGIIPFVSDGCSLFPDGSFKVRDKWTDCCRTHDRAYWQGGSADERKQADENLRDCVRARTNDRNLAETIYLGVRAGGHPAFPTGYRWGYGWPYGRGYRLLSDAEKTSVQEQLSVTENRILPDPIKTNHVP